MIMRNILRNDEKYFVNIREKKKTTTKKTEVFCQNNQKYLTKNKTTSRNIAKYDKERKILLVTDVEQSACIKK